MRRLLLLLAVALVSHAAPALAKKSDKPEKPLTMGMVTGPKTGTYIAIGRDIARVAKPLGIEINVKPSDGSVENIKRIGSKENAALGIVQSDVLSFLARSQSGTSREMSQDLRLVLPLYREEVHVLARGNITRFADLQDKRVIIGEDGSGHMLTSINLLAIEKIVPSELIRKDPPQGLLALLDGKADAMIFVAGKPVKLFKNLASLDGEESGRYAHLLSGLHFLPLDDPRMLEEYRPAQITPEDYPFVRESVPTIAVTAVLVSHDFSGKTAWKKRRCAALGRLSHAIRAQLGELKQNGHPKWSEVDFSAPPVWKKDACSDTP